MESVSCVCLLMEFTPVELFKVTWQFGFGHPIHHLQLPFYLTPEALNGVAVFFSQKVGYTDLKN